MLFKMKNAGETYQRLGDSTFQSQIGRNLEAYMDNIVIKSKDEKMLLADIAETFDNLKKINMKLNPKKCSFGVKEGNFLGYMVTSKGFRANPKKTKDLADLQSPRTLKEMQSLSEKLASLNRFFSKSAERSLPFFNTLKNIIKENKREYRWMEEAEEAFQQIKKLILDHPSLTAPWPKETLYAYLTVSAEAVSAVLLTDRKGRQCLMQYVSRTLNEAERNYAPMEKLALSLIHMTRRLRRYFEAHPVKLITDQPIKHILNKTESLRKLAKYAVELGAYNIMFVPRNAVKGQVLADFLSEAPKGEKEEIGAGLVLIGPSGIEYTCALCITFSSTNNEVEYEALLVGLRIARQINISNIEVKVDSKLVASQINRNYEASKYSMIKNMNQKADVLSKFASVAFNHLTKEVLVEYAMESGVLFKKVYLVPMLRCVGPLQANYIIREIHMGSCGMHVGPRVVVKKAIMQGAETTENSHDVHHGPLAVLSAGHGHLGTATAGKRGVKFGLPRITVTDNGAQLVNDPFKSWCGRFAIQQMNTTVAHPQANDMVEKANRSLMEGIKTLIGRERASWVDELPDVLWAHQTSIKQSNGEKPFSLTYGSDAVIPAEIGIPTYQTLMIREEYNEDEMRLNLELLQERRETTAIREARYKTKMEQYYNKKVRSSGFKTHEFMFRRNKASMVEDQGKLGPK
nr:reverse transcriptase domain-containing protein [Tanacetum cinerariifolium]